MQSGRNDLSVGGGVASQEWEKGGWGNLRKSVCFLHCLRLGSEARGKTGTKPVSEKRGKQQLSTEEGEIHAE